MATYLRDKTFLDAQAECTFHVSFENRNFLRSPGFEEVQKWLTSDAASGNYVAEGTNFVFCYSFSDPNTAMEFKLRFA